MLPGGNRLNERGSRWLQVMARTKPDIPLVKANAGLGALANVLKDETSGAGGGRARARLRGLLVAGQVALSLLLLVGASLVLQGLQRAQVVNPGFDPSHAIRASFDLFPNGYSTEEGLAFQRRLVERLEATPGVESAAVAVWRCCSRWWRFWPATCPRAVPRASIPSSPSSRSGASDAAVTPRSVSTYGTTKGTKIHEAHEDRPGSAKSGACRLPPIGVTSVGCTRRAAAERPARDGTRRLEKAGITRHVCSRLSPRAGCRPARGAGRRGKWSAASPAVACVDGRPS